MPGLQPNSHRSSQQSQVQNLGPQQTPTFMQQRGQPGGFGFSGTLGQHQPSSLQQQQQQQQQQMPAQQQTNGTSSSIPLHLAQTGNLGAPSVSSASEVNLDPNDFPALGSVPVANNNSNTSGSGGNGVGVNTTSYASQAGLGSSSGGSGSIGNTASNQSRDFTADDFPALGGQTQPHQNSSQSHSASQDNHPHPPGLNGFQHNEHSQHHRQSLPSSFNGSLHQGTPGILNLGAAQSRNVHPGFQQGQTEAEKQQRVSLSLAEH